jgi:hypothetical protein
LLHEDGAGVTKDPVSSGVVCPPGVAHGKLELDCREIKKEMDTAVKEQEHLIRLPTPNRSHDVNRRSKGPNLFDFDSIDSDRTVLAIGIADGDDRMRSLARRRARSECQTKGAVPLELDASAANVGDDDIRKLCCFNAATRYRSAISVQSVFASRTVADIRAKVEEHPSQRAI